MKFIFLTFFNLFLFIYCHAQQYEIDMLHENMDIEIGSPAIIKPGENYPTFSIYPELNGELEGRILRKNNDSIVKNITSINLSTGKKTYLNFSQDAQEPGRYRVDLQIHLSGETFHESFFFTVLNVNRLSRRYSVIVHPGEEDELVYIPDYQGNRIPDYSMAGYKGGGVDIPESPVKYTLEPKDGDDTQRIQEAIDKVSEKELNSNGIRGAVLLKKGIYEINEKLTINNSGVILKGEGKGDFKELWLVPSNNYDLATFKNSLADVNATVIIATGEKRRTLIEVSGDNGPLKQSSAVEIIDQYVPVGANHFRVESSEKFTEGDKIILQRSGNSKWISDIDMDQIPDRENRNITQWEAFDLNFEYTIQSIEDNIITIDGNILNAVESKYGGGRIYKYTDEGRIQNVGIENMRAISYWKPDKYGVDDTRHADRFLRYRNAKNCWVSDVTLEHFFSTGGSINVHQSSKNTTIKNSSALIADNNYYSGESYRGRTHQETNIYVGRQGFRIAGQSTLVMGCYALNNRHAFAVDKRVSGPNVFLFCKGENSLTWSEPHHRWSVGGLFDNVDDKISIMNRLNYGSGHGWAGANYVAWNTKGELICEKPPTAQNWAIGHSGKREKGPFIEYGSEGYWENTEFPLKPGSLYLKQLEDRLGAEALPEIDYSFFHNNDLSEEYKVWNYPNPAKHYTNFVYELDSDGFVKLELYSMTGKLITTIDHGQRKSGKHEVFWETVDNTGRPLPSGLYIYRLVTESEIKSNKIIISR